jgi:hypothetical protein
MSGWVVVDITWHRGPLRLGREGWLGETSCGYDPTVFATRSLAEQAIAETLAWSGGKYTWQKNTYVAVEVNN